MRAQPSPTNTGAWAGFFSRHWPIILLTCLAIFPLFADLGGDYLWSDEGDTAVLGRTILKCGLPKAWDGRTFTDADFGQRENKDLVMVSHPWLQYYVAAGSFWAFGETTFAARFPFALAGLLTIPLFYFFVIQLTNDRRAALATGILLTLSIQFLLFSRQCRNYSLNMFLAGALLLLFFRLTNWRIAVLFSIAGILLFHSNPSGLAPLGALGVLTLIRKSCAPFRKYFWISAPFIALFTLPWIFQAKAGYEQNTTLIQNWHLLMPRLIQFFIECASVTPIVGVIALFVWVWIRAYREWKKERPAPKRFSIKEGRQISHDLFTSGERTLVMTAGLIFFSYSLLVALTLSRTEMFTYGLRYATPIIPLTMALIGILISKASQSSRRVWVILMLVLSLTKVGRITPFAFVDQERAYFDGSVFAAMHVPQGWENYIFRTALVSFARELWKENRGAVARISDFLNKNAQKEDILITNYEWEPVYFHTRLRQGLKIMPSFPIFQTALNHHLPEYVFTLKDVRWIVWRWAWDGYREYSWEPIFQTLTNAGASVTEVATIPESTWENRPEVHFHRFPGEDYKYPWFPDEQEPDAKIYRIDWPKNTQPPASSKS